jgi:EmrB/QacA subfamily drug resistance transporter
MINGTKNKLAFVAVIFGFFMALLDTTIINITLPEMMSYYNTTLKNITWVINGYNLAFAVFIITASRLADQFGRKRIFGIGIFFFTLMSFLCAISSSSEMLILFRVLQGLFGGIILPVSIPLALDLAPEDKQGKVLGIWSVVSGLAAASGPTLGGFLADQFNWQSIFLINVPIGIVALFLVIFCIKESYDPTAGKQLDILGMSTLSISLFSITYALIQANDEGWTSPFILSLFLAFLIFMALFVWVELTTKKPMIPLSLLRNVTFNAASLTLLILGAGIMTISLLISFFMTRLMGLSELEAGVTLSVMPLSSAIFSVITSLLLKRVGERWLIIAGMGCIALSMFLMNDLTAASDRLDVIYRLAIAGAGMGFALAPTMNSAIGNVPKDKVGITSGIMNMTRSIGAVLGVAIIVTILNTTTGSEIAAAKSDIIDIIHSDKVFSAAAQEELISAVNEIEVSSSSEVPQMESVIGLMQERGAKLLAGVAPDKLEMTKAVLQAQQDEVKKLWPERIQPELYSGLVSSFSDTFKYGSACLLLGILFSFFIGTGQRQEQGTEIAMDNTEM